MENVWLLAWEEFLTKDFATITNTKLKKTPTKKSPTNDYKAAEVICAEDSTPIDLAVYGDPIVGQALTLLLRGCRYNVKFLSTSSLEESEALADVRLLILTPRGQLSTRCYEVLLAALENEIVAIKTPILELVIYLEENYVLPTREDRFVLATPWPCRIKELEQHIEAALLAISKAHC
jgi:hypothetical protein